MDTNFSLKVDGFTLIKDESEITELIDMYNSNSHIKYAAIACHTPGLLQQASEMIPANTDVQVLGILTVDPNSVNDDLITSVSIRGVHIDFLGCDGERALGNIGLIALKCARFGIATYITNMEWGTFQKLLADYQDSCTFVYVIPNADAQSTLISLQDKMAQDKQKVMAGQLPPLFAILDVHSIHDGMTSTTWISQHVPLIINSTGVGSIAPLKLSSTTSQLFIMENHETAINIDISDIGSRYITFLLKQDIGRAKWMSD